MFLNIVIVPFSSNFAQEKFIPRIQWMIVLLIQDKHSPWLKLQSLKSPIMELKGKHFSDRLSQSSMSPLPPNHPIQSLEVKDQRDLKSLLPN